MNATADKNMVGVGSGIMGISTADRLLVKQPRLEVGDGTVLNLTEDAPERFATGSAHSGAGISACVRSGNEAFGAVSELLG